MTGVRETVSLGTGVVVGGLNAHQNDPSDPHLFGPVESCRAAPYSFKIEHLGAGARYVCIPSYFP